MIAGIVLYIVTSRIYATSETIDKLVTYRFLHVLGSGAAMVIVLGMVRDLYERDGVARALSLMMLVWGLHP